MRAAMIAGSGDMQQRLMKAATLDGSGDMQQRLMNNCTVWWRGFKNLGSTYIRTIVMARGPNDPFFRPSYY